MTDTPTPAPELQGWGLLLKPPIEHTRSCPELSPLSEERCTCGYEWRIRTADYMTAYNAWRKRAEAAETAIAARDAEIAAERKRADIWELDARTAQANWHAACDDIAAHCAEIAKLHAALRGETIRPTPNLSGRAEQAVVCNLCRGRWNPDDPERHAPGCLAAERTQGTP